MTVAWKMAESRGGDRSLVFNAGRLDVDPPRVAECCNTVDGYCRDYTRGTPCCAYGDCNVFCCNCDGGCRKHQCDTKKSGLAVSQWPMSVAETSLGNFSAVDRNGDGDISLAEWTTFAEETIVTSDPERLHHIVQYYFRFANLGSDGEYHLGQSEAETPKGSVMADTEEPHASDCCNADIFNYCRDCTVGSPCCGYGECNVFCCNCDGGCRKPPTSELSSKRPSKASGDDCVPSKFAAVDLNNDGIITEYEWSMHASKEIMSAGVMHGTDHFATLHKLWMDYFHRFAILVNGECLLTMAEAYKRG